GVLGPTNDHRPQLAVVFKTPPFEEEWGEHVPLGNCVAIVVDVSDSTDEDRLGKRSNSVNQPTKRRLYRYSFTRSPVQVPESCRLEIVHMPATDSDEPPKVPMRGREVLGGLLYRFLCKTCGSQYLDADDRIHLGVGALERIAEAVTSRKEER